jgi:ABC-2 type transport system permease protein
MNIFIQEMKAHRKSLIFWCVGMIFMVAAGMGKFSAISSTGKSANEIFDKMPKLLRVIFGIGDFDLSKTIGYFGVLFIYLLLMATIHAAMLGADVISKEERDKTSEFLFVKPASRTKIITAKLLAALVNITILNIITLISSIGIMGKYSKGEAVTGDIIILMIGMFITQLIFMLIGTGLAAVSKNPKTSTSIATGILLVLYMLSVIIDMNSNLENLKYINPLKYFEAKNLINGGGFDPVFVGLSVVIIGLLVASTYVFYKKRDLKI